MLQPHALDCLRSSRSNVRRPSNRRLALFQLVLLLVAWPLIGQLPVAMPDTIDANFPGAHDVALLDWNQDGKLDVIGTSRVNDYVDRWVQGLAVGLWNPGSFSGAGQARGLAAGDIDGDGSEDIAVAVGDVNGSNDRVVVVLNRSAILSVQVDTTTNDWPYSADLADIDGDGDLDLLSGSFQGGGVAYWYENTDGVGETWTTHQTVTGLSGVYEILGVDVDQDGDNDMLVSTGTRIAWIENRLNESATTWLRHDIATGLNQAVSVDFADIDSDGQEEVIGSTVNTPLLQVFERTSTVTDPWTAQTLANTGHTDLQSYDLDQDGDLDLVALTFGGELTWWENAGSGSLSGPNVLHDFDGADARAALGDVDRDGDLDFVVATGGADSVEWVENETVRSSARLVSNTPVPSRFGDPFPEALQIVDFDGDGDQDLVSFDSDERLVWRETVSASPQVLHDVNATLGGSDAMDVGDMDGDGDLDVVIATDDDGIEWYEQVSLPTALTRKPIFASIDLGAVLVADWNGDGALDIFGWDKVNTSLVAFTNSGGGASFPGGTISAAPTTFGNMAAADMNRDGRLDLVAVTDDKVVIYENTTTGWVADSISGAEFSLLTLGDFDQDGWVDAAAYSPSAEQVGYLINPGSSGDWTITMRDFLESVSVLRSVDLDLDGDLDVLGMGSDGSAIQFGRGPGEIPSGFEDLGQPSSLLAVADLTEDGYADAVFVEGGAIKGFTNEHGQFGVSAGGSSEVTGANGGFVEVVDLDLSHLGRFADVAIALRGLGLEFLDGLGDPLSGGEVDGLISQLALVRRDGSDTELAVINSPDESTVQFDLSARGAPDATVDPPADALSASVGNFVVVAQLESDASAVLSEFRVRVRSEEELDVRDPSDVRLEGLPWSGRTVEVNVVDGVIFSDGFETANTSAWSSTTP